MAEAAEQWKEDHEDYVEELAAKELIGVAKNQFYSQAARAGAQAGTLRGGAPHGEHGRHARADGCPGGIAGTGIALAQGCRRLLL